MTDVVVITEAATTVVEVIQPPPTANAVEAPPPTIVEVVSIGPQGAQGETGSPGLPMVKRVVTQADATSITPDIETTDVAAQDNTQASGTLTVHAPTGTPMDGQQLIFRIKFAHAQTYDWNAVYVGSPELPLPYTSSSGNKFDYLGFIYNSEAAVWQLIASVSGF